MGAGTPPVRLGTSDNWGVVSASAWKSDEKNVSTPSKYTTGSDTGKTFFYSDIADGLTLILAVMLFLYTLSSTYYVPSLTGSSPMTWLPLAAAVSLTHMVYAFVWYFSKTFKGLCAKLKVQPVNAFATLVLVFKAQQQLNLLYWANLLNVPALMTKLAALSPLEWLAIALLMGVGQA
jgi:hypothetical protein